MLEVTINNKKICAEPGKTIIQVADENGVKIPRFCYHKNLRVVAQCRMCLVEVGGSKKPLAACSTPITDKMVVNTASPMAKEAQKSVLEFLLLNHPLDCPICDKGGECPLQDNTFQYGTASSRMEDIKRRLDKNVDFGNNIVFDTERCILCSRCERFCKDVTGTAEIGIVQRGAKSEISVFDENGVYNDFSLNIVDLCPVGALTNKDFRFRARPWEMKRTESFCPSCPLGCKSSFWVKTSFKEQKILRMTSPGDAENWLCDFGRSNYKVFNNQENHLKDPLVRKNGVLQKTSWEEAIDTAKKILSEKNPSFALSGNLTSESLDTLSSLLEKFHFKFESPLLNNWKIMKEKNLLEKQNWSRVVELGTTIKEAYPVLWLDLRNTKVEFESAQKMDDLPISENTALAISEKILNTKEFEVFLSKVNKKISIIPLFTASNTIALLEKGLLPWHLCHPEPPSRHPEPPSRHPEPLGEGSPKAIYFVGRTLKQNFDYESLKKIFGSSKLIVQDTVTSPLCDIAEVVLPMQDLAESGGSFKTYYSLLNNKEDSKFTPCMNVSGNSKPDWEIFQLFLSP